jgi:DNA mismatch endonuclease, patch repair protein
MSNAPDNIDPRRSALMRRIREKDTRPELAVRRMAHSLGYRFRLQWRDLPGTPDLTFPARRKVIFIHGCFWHRHPGCHKASTPKTRIEFWEEKFVSNIERDKQKSAELRLLGWDVLVVWECETQDALSLGRILLEFLERNSI